MMRIVPVSPLVLVFMIACGGPLPGAETPSPLSLGPSGDAGAVSDASPAAFDPYHLLTVSLCERDIEGCKRVNVIPEGAPYRVALGSSGGERRNRDQAIADLYRELRDRTALGARLVARVHRLDVTRSDAGGSKSGRGAGGKGSTATDSVTTDALIDAARQMMDAVDTAGEVTLDTSHEHAGCKLAFASEAAGRDGTGRCLIRGEDRGNGHEGEGTRYGGDTGKK
jgi:hypothetical protein